MCMEMIHSKRYMNDKKGTNFAIKGSTNILTLLIGPLVKR